MADFDPPIRASLQDEDCDLFSDDDARFRAALDAATTATLRTLAVTEYALYGLPADADRALIRSTILATDAHLHGGGDGL
jgi:hypothetical protein